MLGVIMLSVIMLSVIMLSVIMLSVIMLIDDMLSVIMLSVIMLSVIMLSVIMLSVIMLGVIMLSVIMQSFVALLYSWSSSFPSKYLHSFYSGSWYEPMVIYKVIIFCGNQFIFDGMASISDDYSIHRHLRKIVWSAMIKVAGGKGISETNLKL